MKPRSIAVIGANSFLATHLLRELERFPYHLHLWGRRAVEVAGDNAFSVFNYPDAPLQLEQLLSFDAIIFTAGAGIQSNVPTSSDAIYEVNAFLPIRMIQFLQDQGFGGQVITFGSYFEIGNSLEAEAYSEEAYITNANAVPNNYCISKRLLTQYISQKLPQLAFSLTHFVLPNIYGVGENEARIIPYLVASIEQNLPISLTSGTQRRQFLHVRDVAAAVVGVLERPAAGIFNLGSQDVLSIRELVQLVMDQASGKALPEVSFGTVAKKDAGMQFLALNDEKARRELGWRPVVRLQEGIREYFKKEEPTVC